MKRTKVVDHSHDDELHNEGVAHEISDVNVRAILSFGAIVVVTAVVCAVIVWGMFVLLERQAAGRDPQQSQFAVPPGQMPPTTALPQFGNAPAPKLLTNEPGFLLLQRQAEDARLHEYGWVDQKAGVARVSIEQAKKLIAERGLPARASAADPQLGTHAPAHGEASGGRTIPTGERPAGAAAAPPPAAAPAPAAPETAKEPPAHAPAGRGGGA